MPRSISRPTWISKIMVSASILVAMSKFGYV